MSRALGQLVIAPETLSWLDTTVVESDKTGAGAREGALKQLIRFSLYLDGATSVFKPLSKRLPSRNRVVHLQDMSSGNITKLQLIFRQKRWNSWSA